MTVRAWRDAYSALGWFVHPIGPGLKSPYDPGWPDKDYSAEHFGDDANLGLNLGRSCVADVDLDSPESRVAAASELEPTWVFGRASSPASHWVYACPESAAGHRRVWSDPTVTKGQPGWVLHELRVGRTQTMLPPSRHPSGEAVIWSVPPSGPSPTVRSLADLERDCARVAARGLLARHYAPEGTRDDFAMHLAGALARAGWGGDEISAFCVGVAEDAGDADARSRAKGIATVAAHESGVNVTGLGAMSKIIDPRVVSQVASWLEIQSEAVPEAVLEYLAPEAIALRSNANQGLGWHDRESAEKLADLKRVDLIGYNQTITRLKTDGVPNIKAIEANVASVERERRKARGETTGLVLGREGKATACEANVAAVLAGMPGLTYDDFARRTVWQGVPVADSELMRLTIEIQTHHGISASKALVGSVALYPPDGLFPRSHAVRDWLLGLAPWDGQPRLAWLPTAFGVRDPERLDAIYFRNFCLSAVRRVCGGGAEVKADDLLVLSGRGGIAKSSGIKALLPSRTWYSDARMKIDDPKSVIEQTSGKWIIELPELAVFERRTDEAIKQFLSAESDKARKAYAHVEVEVGRQWVPVGTTNRHDTLAKFEGEDRRFAPIDCYRQIDLAWLVTNRDALWAEALAGARTNEPHWIVPGSPEWADAESRRSTHRGDSPQAEIVAAWLESDPRRSVDGVTTREVLEGALQIVVPAAQDRSAAISVGRLLRECGWSARKGHRGARRYYPGVE